MIGTILIVLCGIVFGVPIIIHTVGPFIIWKTQKLPAIVKFEPIDDEVFIKERNEKFINYDKSIIELGFEIIGSSMLCDSHTDSHFRLYWNSTEKVAAMVVSMKSHVEEMTYIEFNQKFRDGSVLDVSNSPRPEGYPNLEIKQAYRFPDILSAKDLLAVYSKLKWHIKRTVSPVDYKVEDGFGEMEDFIKRESDALLEKGIVKPEIDEDGKRSLTFLGAVALTYRAVPPGKNIWGLITERRAKNALRGV